MARLRRMALSSRAVPKSWRGHVPLSSGIFAFDCYRVAAGTELVIRFEEKHAALLSELHFMMDGRPLVPQITPIPRGARLGFEGATGQTLTVNGFGETVSLPIGGDQATFFEGKRVLFTVAVEPRADILADWMRFHAGAHGAQVALILLRRGPEFDTKALHDALAAETDAALATMLVDCALPLGHPKMPAESARHLAPDGPGKAMLEDPSPDPWRSPLSELAILEVARRRFLRKARSVLYCQPFDLVTSEGASLFEAAEAEGFVKIPGKRAYPYALKDPKRPRHSDHNCVSFDGRGADPIWCASAPALEPGAFWRQFRISNLETGTASGLSYWRCMAVRHPGLKVGELAAKSSLVESAELSDLITRAFGKRPKAPPKAARTDRSLWKNERILVVTTMKNEGPFILEWLAYHRAIGVTDFLVYTNDCTDGTDAMFDLLHKKGIVTHAENPYRASGLKPQHAALQDAESADVTGAADWIICMDVDEFINVHVGDGTLGALFDRVPEASMISLTWRLFGNADVAAFKDRPIMEQFDLCAPAICRKPHQAWGFKTLFRNIGHYKKFGVHRPKGLRPEYLEDIHWVNGSGAQMPGKILRTGWRSSTSSVGYNLVSLNHYALRSAESFLVKRDRGRVNHVDRDQGLAYWFRMNHNAQVEQSIQARLPMMQEELARLVSDPEIAAAHAASVAAHRARIAELMAAPEYQTLYGEITGTRLRALSRMLHHFGNQVFLDGPDAVPADYHLQKA